MKNLKGKKNKGRELSPIMILMAIRNPQANFNFRLQLDGINNAAVQTVTVPKVEFAEHKGGAEGNSPDVKTPGKKIVGDLTVEMQVPDDGDPDFWNKFDTAQSMNRPIYCGDGYLYETDQAGAPVQTFVIKEAWGKSAETANYERKGDNSADLMRTIIFSVGDFYLQ